MNRLVTNCSGVRYVTDVYGKGSDTLVILHGIGECKEVNAPLIAQEVLRSTDYSVIAPTLRAHFDADTEGSYRGSPDLDLTCSDLAAIINQAGSEMVSFLGGSYGGFIALLMATEHEHELNPSLGSLITINAPRSLAVSPVIKALLKFKPLLKPLYEAFIHVSRKIRGHEPMCRLGNLEFPAAEYEGLIKAFSKSIDIDLLGIPYFMIQSLNDETIKPWNYVLKQGFGHRNKFRTLYLSDGGHGGVVFKVIDEVVDFLNVN